MTNKNCRNIFILPENTYCRDKNEVLEHASYKDLSEKWVSACKLKAGDKVLLSDGKYGIIVSVKIEELETPETTYNFEVEDFHTYFVGENPVCVHNAGCNINQMNTQIKKGQAPKGIERVDKAQPSVKNSKIHVHFKDGTSLNIDGTVHDANGGIPKVGKQARVWLEKYGWQIPDIFRR